MSRTKAIAAPSSATPRENIIRKAVKKIEEPLNDYEKSLELIDKHGLPTVYGVLGSDVTHGAASHHDKNIKIKDAYTPGTMIKRGFQRAAIGVAAGAGLAYLDKKHADGESAIKNISTSTAIGALAGATLGPAMMYGAGKLAEHYRLKNINKKDKNAKRR